MYYQSISMILKVFPAKIKVEMLTDAYRCTEILTFGRYPTLVSQNTHIYQPTKFW